MNRGGFLQDRDHSDHWVVELVGTSNDLKMPTPKLSLPPTPAMIDTAQAREGRTMPWADEGMSTLPRFMEYSCMGNKTNKVHRQVIHLHAN